MRAFSRGCGALAGEWPMTVGRRIWLLMAVAARLDRLPGGRHGLALAASPARRSTQESFDVDEFVAEHNRNAEPIQSLEAKPVDRGLDGPSGRHFARRRPHGHGAAAQLQARAVLTRGQRRPTSARTTRNSGSGSPIRNEPYIYWCNYDDLESSALAVTYQPDWIIEALGLKPISPEEAAMIQVENGAEPGTTALVFPAVRNQRRALHARDDRLEPAIGGSSSCCIYQREARGR